MLLLGAALVVACLVAPVFPSPGWPCCSVALADTLSAQALVAAPTQVALTDLLTGLATVAIGIFAVVLRGVGKAVVAWFEARTKIQVDDSLRGLLHELCQRGLEYAMAVSERKLRDAQLTVDAHNVIVAEAANYVLAHAPDALAHFGLDRDGVIRMVTARLTQEDRDIIFSAEQAASPPTAS
jgi:hypothetical protein